MKMSSAVATLVALMGLLASQQACAQAYRVGRGIQMIPGASRPSTELGRRTLWVDNANSLRFYNGTSDLTLSSLNSYGTIADEGSSLTQRSTLNFTGAGVSCVDNAGSSRTDCTIAGGGGSTGNWTFAGDAADDSGAAVLTIGATTATGVTLSRSAGTITLAGNTTVAAGKNITAAAGAGAFDLSAASGVFKTPTGASTFGGSSNTFSASIKPSVDNTIDLGDATHRFQTVFANYVNTSTVLSLGSTGNATYTYSAAGYPVNIMPGGNVVGAFYEAGTQLSSVVQTSGANTGLLVTGAAHTGQTASTEVPDVDFALNRTLQHATGAITTQRAVLVRAPTYSFVGASTISDAATVAVTGAPAAGANGTITRSWSLWTQDGAVLHERDDIGATVGTLGLLVQNRTAATSGNQKYSPTLALEGQGWKTNATAASQSVRYELQTIPIQGAAAPTGELRISESINGGAETTLLQIGSSAITASVPVVPSFTTTTVAPSWSTVTYQNSWDDYSGSLTTRYTKDAQGIVTLLIAMKTGSNGTVSFNMPAGYRPSQTVIQTGSTLAGAIAICELATNGDLTTDVSSTSGSFFRLTYYAEN